MATQSEPQLVRLAEVADTIGAPLMWVVNAAGKDVRAWWTGEPAVTFDVARKIAERWARNVADATEKTRAAEAEQAAQVEREREQYRREREAERTQKGVPIPGGVSVSVPGDPHTPNWMKGTE
jgi:hypothetical protein